MDSASICADCGAKDPEWASLNRCVLICSECCYVHRNLGSHLSRIRSLKHGIWSKEQLDLIRFLYASGSNNIWEHSLIDPSSSNKAKIKPTANDAVIPTKENFIKAKYAQLAFALKPARDETSLDDLNRQLWSCVRTDRVETTLRLLALGANVNYADPEKQNSPLHIAAKENQRLQVELLAIYGADPARPNAGDLTAVDVARLENHNELTIRLEEIQFEITDRLSLFLCGRRPEHARQVHFLVPELVGNFQQRMAPAGEIVKVRKEMTTISGLQLEKIAQDIYDEVDRRDVVRASSASALQNIDHGADQFVAVFLPPNPSLSATRNQLRQKLAKYDTADFATLIIDVLSECKRRFYDLPVKCDEVPIINAVKTRESSKVNSAQNSEDPSILFDDGNRDYDEVAYSPRSKSRTSNPTKRWSDTRSENGERNQTLHPEVTLDDYLELKEKLHDSNSKVRELTVSNVSILRHLSSIQETMTELKNDNVKLHTELRSQKDHNLALLRRNPSPTTHLASPSTGVPPIFPKPSSQDYRMNEVNDSWESGNSKPFLGYSTVARPFGGTLPPRTAEKYRNDNTEVPLMSKYADPLIKETEVLTSAIRNLLSDAQSGMLAGTSVSHACTISRLIQKIVALIPEIERTRRIEVVMNNMVEASVHLTDCCSANIINSEETCSAAYNLAKSVKEYLKLVTGQE